MTGRTRFLNSIALGVLPFVFSLPTTASPALTMRDVFDALAYLLPLSAQYSADIDDEDRDLIDSHLHILQSASEDLVNHARGHERDFELHAKSFDLMVEHTAHAFKRGWPQHAHYSMLQLTEHCVSCHSRYPARSEDSFGQRLMARMKVDEIPAWPRARLYVATRQFDAALSDMEKNLMAPWTGAVDADLQGSLVDYLRISLSVYESLTRPREFLIEYRKRDLPYFLDNRIEHWLGALDRNEVLFTTGLDDLNLAQQLFEEATTSTLVPGSWLRAVEDFLAARIFRDYLRKHKDAAPAVQAKIYYQLAIITLRTAQPDPTVPEMEMQLVACIEAEPRGPYARRAFALLQEYGYVPDDHLADHDPSNPFIDMVALRQKVGLAR
ncbi:MAG: hypothetical protein AAF384_11840 [Pseudomonadota bacterium]